MSTPVLVAIITAAGLLAGGIITAVVTVGTMVWQRFNQVERTNNSLWEYTRILIDHIYRGGLGPPPPPPEHIKNIYDLGTND